MTLKFLLLLTYFSWSDDAFWFFSIWGCASWKINGRCHLHSWWISIAGKRFSVIARRHKKQTKELDQKGKKSMVSINRHDQVPIVINCDKKMKFKLNREITLFFPIIVLCSLIGRCSVQGHGMLTSPTTRPSRERLGELPLGSHQPNTAHNV